MALAGIAALAVGVSVKGLCVLRRHFSRAAMLACGEAFAPLVAARMHSIRVGDTRPTVGDMVMQCWRRDTVVTIAIPDSMMQERMDAREVRRGRPSWRTGGRPNESRRIHAEQEARTGRASSAAANRPDRSSEAAARYGGCRLSVCSLPAHRTGRCRGYYCPPYAPLPAPHISIRHTCGRGHVLREAVVDHTDGEVHCDGHVDLSSWWGSGGSSARAANATSTFVWSAAQEPPLAAAAAVGTVTPSCGARMRAEPGA